MSRGTGQFSLVEQLWMQLSFHGIWILGAVAMYSASPLLAIGYVALFPVLGVGFCVVRLWVCSRCPHIKAHGACLQLPPAVARWMIKKDVCSPLTLSERIGFYLVMYGLGLVPLFWVAQRGALLAPYLLTASVHYSGYHLHFCRKCLNVACPFNRAGRARHAAT